MTPPEPTPREAVETAAWRAELLAVAAHRAAQEAADILSRDQTHPEREALHQDARRLATATGEADRVAQDIGARYGRYSLNGRHAHAYAAASAADAYRLAEQVEAVGAELAGRGPDEAAVQAWRQVLDDLGAMLGQAAHETAPVQAPTGWSVDRARRMAADPAYAQRTAAREEAAGHSVADIRARVMDGDTSAYGQELRRVLELVTRQEWEAYRPDQDEHARADEEATP